jgi:hypothetical protein
VSKKHFDRLHAQDQIKRKARRERLRELKVRIAAKPASAAHEAEVTRMPLLSKLEAVARRELAYLRAVGDLPRDYPTLRDVVDEAIVRAKVEWQSVGGKEAYTGLLKHLFAVLDNEVASSNLANSFLWTRRSNRMPKTWPRPWWKRKSSNFISTMTHSSWPIFSLAVSIPMSQRSRNRRS